MNLPLRPLFASMLAPLLVAGVCACSTAAAGNVPGSSPTARESKSPSSDPGALRAFAKEIGVNCETAAGRLACIGGRPEVGDFYDVDLHPGCGNDGLFGGVIAVKGADLRDRIAPIDRRTTARFARGQLLCIEAIGWAGKHASYYYVRQVPAHSVAVCANNSAVCQGYGDRRVRNVATSSGSCAITSAGHLTTACAAGWIRGDDVTRIAPRT